MDRTDAIPVAPAWLRERIANARPERGKMYQLAAAQGYLEVTDWAYFLRSPEGLSLLDKPEMIEALFERVFMRSHSRTDTQVRIVTGARAEHYVVIEGAGIQSELEALNVANYRWNFDPEL